MSDTDNSFESCFDKLTIEGGETRNENNGREEHEQKEIRGKEEEVVKEEKEKDVSLTNITGLVYDSRMANYKSRFLHPERPERILSIYAKLLSGGLVDKCVQIMPRLATKEEILWKHTGDHFNVIQSLVDKTSEELEALSCSYESIYFHKNVSESSLLSAGCTLQLVEEILKGNVLNGAAVVRPPGHHAVTNASMGFCHFNNVALAAMLAITKYNLTRVLIVDWDIHYGNATHKMFEYDPRVLYFSLHRYQFQHFWPCLPEANYDSVGIGKGEGYNIHVAWNKRNIQDCEYLFAFDNVLIPITRQYDPQLILVSCGFDSGKGDPLGGCCVTPAGYAQMTKRLMEFANGKIAIVLEGGYNLDTISNSMEACVSTLLGNTCPSTEDCELHDSAAMSVVNTFLTMCKYWRNALDPLREKFVKLENELKSRQNRLEDSALSCWSSEDESEDLIRKL